MPILFILFFIYHLCIQFVGHNDVITGLPTNIYKT